MVFQWAFLGLMLNFEHLVLSILVNNRAQSFWALFHCWRLFGVLYIRFCILLCCWIVISWTFIPHLSIFLSSHICTRRAYVLMNSSIHSSFKDLSKSVSQIHHLKT